jgi:acetyl-CoA acetyltransferase
LADNPATGSRHAYEKSWGDDDVFGWFGVPSGYAMIAQRHMAEFGTTRDQLGAIVTACRNHGAANPHAQLRKPLTLEQYRQSRPIVAPLTRDDICLVSDGAAAVVVMSAERARQLKVAKPVSILGFGQGQTSWEVVQRPTLTSTAAAASAHTAFKMAGLQPKDMDVAQLYDCFSIVPLMTLEDYGFCKKGEGGKFVSDGNLISGVGKLPFNTDGGGLCNNHPANRGGITKVIEAVRQLRGEAHPAVQVKNCDLALAHGTGGLLGARHGSATLILERA